MNASGPTNVSQQIYAVSSDVLTDFLLWLAIPGLTAKKDHSRIVLLHSISQFASRLVRPTTKWDTK